MTIWKKAISVATSAALLASLLTAVAAPAVFAANTSAGGGTIYPGQAASAPFSFTFAEDSVAQFNSASFTVAVYDSTGVAGDANATWVTTVAPTVTTNLGLGSASAGFVGDTLVVNVSGTDITKIDSFTVSGLRVSATAAAAFGALIFPVTVDTVTLSQVLATASGLTTTLITGGFSTTVAVLEDLGSPLFQVTGATCVGGATVGSVTVAASGVVAAETFATSTASPTLTKATPFTGDKPIGTAVTQQVCAARFPSPVTVGDAVLASNPEGIGTLQAGVNNQDAGNVRAQLGWFNGLLLSGDTVTFTIATAGVLFSPVPGTLVVTPAAITIGTPSLGADRTSVTVAITENATSLDALTFDPAYDVALGVPSGTPVRVGVTVSRAGVVVLGSPVTVAVVGFVAAGATAAPTIFIGQNDQPTGMITIRESAAGVITDAGLLRVRLESGESWSVGRHFWAVVTSGDLRFNVAGLPASQARMTSVVDLTGQWLTVLPFTGSTVASTIEIRDGTATAPAASAPAAGPRVNVPSDMLPGQTFVDVFNGAAQVADNVVIAVRAYTRTATATTSAQLPVVRGGINQAVGSITFTEGFPNEFGTGYDVELCLVYPTVANQRAYIWSNPVGANAPVVTTNSTVSGLIASFDPGDSGDECINLDVTDTGLSGLGTITISNLRLDVKTDAPLGPVFVRIFTWGRFFNGDSIAPASHNRGLLQATVSPAIVIQRTAIRITSATALGRTMVGPFTTPTKTAALNQRITWRFSGGSALAGKRVQIWVATRAADGSWGAWTRVTGRTADGAGNAFFWTRYSSATRISVRAFYPGDAMRLPSWSPAGRQGVWR